MTKAEIIDEVYQKNGAFSRREAMAHVEMVFDIMREGLAAGEKVKVSRFGTFGVHQKNKRVARNPRTGEPVPIGPRKVLRFQPSAILRAILNPHRQE